MSKIDGGATLWARQTIDSDIFYNKPDKWFKIWFYLINEVNHKDNKQFKRGSCFMKYEWIMQKTKANKNEIDHCIRWLKSATMIATRKATRGFILMVLNYNGYQTLENYKSDTKSDSKSELKAKQKRNGSDTINKNDKNDKNDKKKRERAPAVFLSEEEYQKLVTELGEDVAKEYINQLSLYMKSRGLEKKYKSHYATILTWHRNDKKKGEVKKLKDSEFNYQKYESKKLSKVEAEKYKNTAREGIKILTGRRKGG